GGQAAAVVGVPGDDAVRRVDGQRRRVVDVVEDEAGGVAGEGEPEHRRVVGRGELGAHPVLERDAVVVGARGLVVVAELQRARAAHAVGGTGRGRHHLERPSVTDQRSGSVVYVDRLHHG